MNTYSKYIPNVFLAKCTEKHVKGEIITLTTKYGQEHECEIYNLIYEKDGYLYYSIIRADGFNAQERARRKAERLAGYAVNAKKRSSEAYKKADMSEEATGIPFGQPILVGHHSEGRHRRTIERAHNAMNKCIEEGEKAKKYANRAAYWEDNAEIINLSMPESIEFYQYKLEKAEEYHQGLKSGKYPKEHSYSMTYAKKAVNEAGNNLKLAIKLWGDN